MPTAIKKGCSRDMSTVPAVAKKITTPLTDQVIEGLRTGERLLITGIIYTARDTAHKRLIALLDQGKALPFDIAGQIIYYVGPTPPRPGRALGAAGPTTSNRMDVYTPQLIAQGLKGMIGKGARSQEVRAAIRRHKAAYLGATGGAGALLSQCIKKAEVIAFAELGPEAIRRLEVEDFPVVVINDCYGNDLYEESLKQFAR
jgi:fumarate hydratase subunit beta